MAALTRQQMLARIHMIKAKMNWSDDEYRAILADKTGHRSAAELDGPTLARLLRDLDQGMPLRQDRQPKANEWAWANEIAKDKARSIWKIRRLCKELGIAEGSQMAYAEGVAARQFGHERRLKMMTAQELNGLIGPLQRTLASKRAGAEAA